MDHPEHAHDIEAYADGQLDSESALRLQQHLQGCESCARYLRASRRENTAFERAFSPADPPVDLVALVGAQLRDSARRRDASPLHRAALGIAANLVTGFILIALSLGTPASLPLMLVIAAAVAVVWGGIKGLLFARFARMLPGGTIIQGVAFGTGIWIVTTILLALAGGFASGRSFTTSFLLLGSGIHSLVYGLLLSWFYTRFSRGGLRGLRSFSLPVGRTASLLLVLGVLAPSIVQATSRDTNARPKVQRTFNIGAPVPRSLAANAVTATPTLSTGTPTLTATPPPVTITLTVTPALQISPVASLTAVAPTTSPVGTTPTAERTGTPSPRPSPSPQATSPSKRTRSHHATHPSAVRQQVRQIFVEVVVPRGPVTFQQRTRSVVLLLNFL